MMSLIVMLEKKKKDQFQNARDVLIMAGSLKVLS